MGAVKRIKNGEWEKNRRERLNLTFFELSRLLPDHDPTLTLTKLEILNKSITYIKELQERNASLLGTKHNEVLGAEMTSLREQVTELQRRNQQLAELLQTAKISLPPRPLPHCKPLTAPRKWAGKLAPDDSGPKDVNGTKQGESKENPAKPVSHPKLPKKKKSFEIKKNLRTKKVKHPEIGTCKSRRSLVINSSNPLRELNNASSAQSVLTKSETVVEKISSTPLKELNSTLSVQSVSQTNCKRTSVSHCVVKGTSASVTCTSSEKPSHASAPTSSKCVQSTLVLSRTVTLPCTTISLVLPNSKTSIVTVAKSNVLPAPIMATGIRPVLQCNPSLSSLGPGTLIMPNGRIVPVPPPPTVLAPALILLPPTTTTNTSTEEVTTTKSSLKPANSLRPIVPKPRQRDITKTTFSNKVPIPAISTFRQGLCSGPKSLQSNQHITPDMKKNSKKKLTVNKQNVRETRSSTESSVSKSHSEVPKVKVLEIPSIKGNLIDASQNTMNCRVSDEFCALNDKKQMGKCVAKRKCVTCEKVRAPKIAKIVEEPVESIDCADSNKSSQECISVSNLKKCSTSIGSIEKFESNKAPETILRQSDLSRNEKGKSDPVVENVCTLEGALNIEKTAVENKNLAETKGGFENKRITDVTIVTDSVSGVGAVHCSSESISEENNLNNKSIEKTVDQKQATEEYQKDSQISIEGDVPKSSSCPSAQDTLSSDDSSDGKVSHHSSQPCDVDSVVSEETHDTLSKSAPTELNKNHEDSNIAIKGVHNTGKDIILSTSIQQSQLNLKESTKQNSQESLTVNDPYSRGQSQQPENATLCIGNSKIKVVDGSAQVNQNLSVNSSQKVEVFNHSSHELNTKDGDPLIFNASINFSLTQKDETQALLPIQNSNINESENNTTVGSCFSRSYSNSQAYLHNVHQKSNVTSTNDPCNNNHISPDASLNLRIKENPVLQSDHNDNKDKTSNVRVLSNVTENVLNINCGGNERCQELCSTNSNISSSDCQSLSMNIYTNERKESPNNIQTKGNKALNSDSNTVSCANNVHPPNSGNNNFDNQQIHHISCLDSVPSKNNQNVFNEKYQFYEVSHQNISSKTNSLSRNESSTSLNFPNATMKIMPVVNVQTSSSENFFNNGNYQKPQNENVNGLGNKSQNTNPISENNSYMQPLPCSDANTKSKSSVSISSTNQLHFICSQNLLTDSSLASSVTQTVTDTKFHNNDQNKNITKAANPNSIVQGLNPAMICKGSNQQHINITVNVSKNSNCQNQQEISKEGELANKFNSETVKTSVSQSCKSTQVTSLQLSFANNEKHVQNKQQAKQNITNSILNKTLNELKPMCDNKSLIQDDSQELTSLFPTEKLQSCSENLFRDTCTEFRDRNLFMPVNHSYMEEMRLNLPHSDFSNDLLSSLQVPNTGQHPESISPTAAFLLAFPLVSTSKTSDLIAENDVGESQHATPTTILQIGNIEPSSSELFHQTALMLENNQNMMKQSKHANSSKDNSSKQLKDIENFNKFQQMEINELMRNENFSRNNCKDKKQFGGIADQDIFYPCTKKRSTSKTNNYPLPSTIVPQMQDKNFEFSESSMRSNQEHGRQINHDAKKNQPQTENRSNPQNMYNPSSQPYPYNSFSNGNEFMMPNSNYLPSNNQLPTGSSKSMPLASSNFNVISWTTASITSNVNQIDYTTPYCNYPQKPYNNPNQPKQQKNIQSNFEDQRNKDKSVSNINPLPKFTNFQFNNSHSNPEVHGYPQSNHADNTNYKPPESKSKKLKTGPQRAPVNWMTAPDIRPLVPDSSVAPVFPDVMFQHQKEFDFPSAPNNMMILNSSSNITSFNIPTSTSNNPQTFYPNSHFSGADLQLDFTPFPDISTSKPLRNSTNIPNSQPNSHPYSWSPSKSSIQLMPHIDSHMIPSTLPTLVGDLALGTTTPSGPVDTFRNPSMPTTPYNTETPVKKFEKKNETQKSLAKTNEKDCFPSPERRNSRTVPEYCQKTHSHQSTNTSSSFLSVSQLVDQVKTEQSSSSRRTTKSSGSKANNNAQKRNTNNQQSDKSKVSNTINNHNYHNPNPSLMGQRKFDTHSGMYQDIHSVGVGLSGSFSNQQGPWQSEKPARSNTHYKGSYSAESLIADQSTTVQGHVTELPQFPNQYGHPPVVSSASYPSTDFSHQNVQPLEFHQTHQNCFNFPSNSHYSSAPFNPEGDYHMGLDHLFNFNPTSNKHTSTCQPSAKDNRNSGKRGQNKQRREDFTPQWTPQAYSSSVRPKGPVPPHCPPSTSSPSHQGTTTLTNFNLSTIFPEINDKVGMTGQPPPSNFPSASNFRSH